MTTVPSVIGRFEVRRRIGSGGFATVWLAHDPELDAPVAVKILAENWAGHADVRRRFTEEARLLRRVDSDRVVRVYDVGTLPDDRPYLVMTYADAGSLAERMREHPPPWPASEVLRLVEAVAAGLAELHAHGVVHRDAGPRNILLRRTGTGEQVLLGDLGIAKDLRWASGLTQPAGSAGYQAPEQTVVSADIGPATDVYALAVVAAGLLGVSGPPWPATPVGRVLARATAPEPRDRTPTPARFVGELRSALPGPGSEGWPTRATSADESGIDPRRQGSEQRTDSGSGGWQTRPLGSGGTAIDPRRPELGPPEPARREPARREPGRREPARREPGRGRRRWGWRRRTGVAALLVLVLGVGAGVWGATRPVRYVSESGRVAVAVPGDWTATPALMPGESTGEGVRLVDGERSVSVAFAAVDVPAAQVATRRASAGCPRVEAQTVQAGLLRGAAFAYSGCPDDATLAVAGLADPDRPGWVVWVEVRSASGTPTLEDVLHGLTVRPDGG